MFWRVIEETGRRHDNLKVGDSCRRRMPKRALMSGFEKPHAPTAGKGAGRVQSGRRVGLVLRKAVKSRLRQQPPQKEGRIEIRGDRPRN